MKLLRFFLFFGIGIVLCLSFGCNDEPDPVGAGTQPQGDFGTLKADTFRANAHSSSYNLLLTENFNYLMLGKYETYEARICLKFFNWPDSLLGATIKQATLQLRPFYHFGDTVLPIAFNVYRATGSVQGDSLSFDSLETHSSLYYDKNAPINISDPIFPTDTLCTMNIDISVVQKWFISNADTTRIDGINSNDGLILQAADVPHPSALLGFYSCNVGDTALQPTLSVQYVSAAGYAGSYTHKIGNSKYVSKVDPSIAFLANRINVQNGISYRGLISFDNISVQWSAPWSLSIHQAILQITLDSTSSSSRFTPFVSDLLYGFSVGTDNKYDGTFVTIGERLPTSSGLHVYQFDIKGIASQWIKNTSVRRFSLSGYLENSSFDHFSFYGSGSADSLKPRIIITYSIQR